MNLFKTLAGIMTPNADTTIVVRKSTDGKIIVSVSYKNKEVTDPAKDIIAPFVVSGTPEEMDAEFVSLIAEPIEQSAGIQTSMANFEASKKVAQAKSQAAAEAKKKADEEKKANKAKLTKLMDEAKKLDEEKNFSKAISIYNEALALADGTERTKVQAAIDACKKKDQPDIFSSMGFDNEEPETDDAQDGSEETEENDPEEPAESEETEGVNPLDFGE